MPVIVLPYIPSTITVHLGLPDQWAENVTVSFPDYVKNVASSEDVYKRQAVVCIN